MIIIDLDAEPIDPPASNLLGCAHVDTTRVTTLRHLWTRASRVAMRERERLMRLGLRAVAAPLRRSWRLALTVDVDAEIAAADPDTARGALQRFLHDTARVVAVTPGPGGIGQRELGRVPVERIGHIVAEPNELADPPPSIWTVHTLVTASIIVAARDTALVHGRYFDGYAYSDLTPYTGPWPIRRLNAGPGSVRRTPIHRQRVR